MSARPCLHCVDRVYSEASCHPRPRSLFMGRLPTCAALFLALVAGSPLSAALEVRPAAVVLDSPESTQQLLTTQMGVRALDRTRAAAYSVSDPRIAAVDAEGLVQPLSEGRTEI